MASKFLKEALADRAPETKIFIKKYLDLMDKVQELLEEQRTSQEESQSNVRGTFKVPRT